jgi:hypothetical protein
MKSIRQLMLVCLLAASSPVSSFEWQIFHVDTGAKPAVALDSVDEFPHIAYLTEDIPGFVKHGQWNGASFDLTDVAVGYFYGPLDLIVIPDTSNVGGVQTLDGVPHILYHDHQGDTFDLTRGDQTHAFQPSPFSPFWIRQAVEDDGHDGWDNSAAQYESTVHTASIDPAQFGSTSGVEYWNSETVESIGSGPVDYEFGTSIAMDTDGNPHIAYYDFAASVEKSETLKYAKKQNGNWTIETVDEQRGAGKFPAIRISPEGTAAISYYAEDGTIRYARRAESGWNQKWSIRSESSQTAVRVHAT